MSSDGIRYVTKELVAATVAQITSVGASAMVG